MRVYLTRAEGDSAGDDAYSSWRFTASRFAALATVALSVQPQSGPIIPLVGLVAVLCLNEGTPAVLGFQLTPVQGWRYWVRIAIWFGVCVGALLLVFAGTCSLLGWSIPVYRTDPTYLPQKLFRMCVYAPAEEEVVYRSLLALAVFSTVGQTGTILLSGAVFALIHVLGGVASPENQIAGFLVAWAFLKSGTILVPIAMHSVGNFCALSGQLAAWYWLPDVP